MLAAVLHHAVGAARAAGAAAIALEDGAARTKTQSPRASVVGEQLAGHAGTAPCGSGALLGAVLVGALAAQKGRFWLGHALADYVIPDVHEAAVYGLQIHHILNADRRR